MYSASNLNVVRSLRFSIFALLFVIAAGTASMDRAHAQGSESIGKLTPEEKAFLLDQLSAYRKDAASRPDRSAGPARYGNIIIEVSGIASNIPDLESLECSAGVLNWETQQDTLWECASPNPVELTLTFLQGSDPEAKAVHEWLTMRNSPARDMVYRSEMRTDWRPPFEIVMSSAQPIEASQQTGAAGENIIVSKVRAQSVTSTLCVPSDWQGKWNTTHGPMTLSLGANRTVTGQYGSAGHSVTGSFSESNPCVVQGAWQHGNSARNGGFIFLLTDKAAFRGRWAEGAGMKSVTVDDLEPSRANWTGTKGSP